MRSKTNLRLTGTSAADRVRGDDPPIGTLETENVLVVVRFHPPGGYIVVSWWLRRSTR